MIKVKLNPLVLTVSMQHPIVCPCKSSIYLLTLERAERLSLIEFNVGRLYQFIIIINLVNGTTPSTGQRQFTEKASSVLFTCFSEVNIININYLQLFKKTGS